MNAPCLPGPVTLRILVAMFALPPVLAAGPESGKATYTLFMGADIELEQGKTFYRVEDVEGSFFKIRVGGKDVMISTRDGTSRMRIGSSLKLAGTPMSIGKLTAERDYTPARDPRLKFAKVAGAASGAGAAADRLAAGQFVEPFFVKVDADGHVLGTYSDRECTRAGGDSYVDAFIAKVLFAPGLDKGKPVPGVARVQLGKLLN